MKLQHHRWPSQFFILAIALVLLPSLGLAQKVQRSMLKFPDTGQTTKYSTFSGEDADVSINPPTYRVIDASILVDTVTSLMWQRQDSGELSYEAARVYCDTLSLGAYTDWRLPTVLESMSILNLDRLNPALNTDYFSSTGAEYWWTSDRQVGDSSKVWVTNAGGGVGPHPRTESQSAGGTKKFHVRAVRATTPAREVQRLELQSAGVVRDNMTDLQWQASAPNTTMTWEAALVYADTALIGGYTDWRLPNVKELFSITDLTRTGIAINGEFFPGASAARYWSSTTQYNTKANAWFVDTQKFGLSSYAAKTELYHVMLVRGPEQGINSIDERSNMNDVTISPQPANDRLRVRATGGTQLQHLTLISALGQELLHFDFHEQRSECTLDLQCCNNGMCVLLLSTNTSVRVFPLMVQH